MSIPAGETKFVLTWTMPGGERAQSAWWEKGHAQVDSTDSQVVLMAASAPFTTWIGTIKPLWSANTILSGLDAYFYNGGNAAVSHGHADLNIIGTGPTSHPNQVACVLTLRTAIASRRARGRMYIPANGVTTQATGLASGAQVDAAVTGTAAWFQVRNSINPSVVVVSQTGTSDALVTSVSADYIPDTQRRRNNKLSSGRKTVAV